jgi:predicted RNase H-like HicB family nuclease
LAKTKEEARKKMQEAADNLKKTLHDTMHNKP